MPMVTPSSNYLAAVQSGAYQRALKVALTIGSFGVVDVSANVVGLTWEEGDQSSYPADLTDLAGLVNTAGSFTLSGTLNLSGTNYTVVQVFNPDDNNSPLYHQQLQSQPVTVFTGVTYQDGTSEGATRSGYTTTIEVDRTQGQVVVSWSDISQGFASLPVVNPVFSGPPIVQDLTNNLTSEFAIDQIARAASDGFVSTWQTPNAANLKFVGTAPTTPVLSVGFRTSATPETGVLNSAANMSYYPGVYGTAFVADAFSETLGGCSYTVPYNAGGALYCEFLFHDQSNSGTTGALIVQAGGYQLGVQGSFIFLANQSGEVLQSSWTNNHTPHWIGFMVENVPPADGVTAAGSIVAIMIDGVEIASTATNAAGFGTVVGVTNELYFMASIESLNIVTYNQSVSGGVLPTQTTLSTFTPKLTSDASLNTLQATPGIDQGSDAYDILQDIAEAELGWVGFRNGQLFFRNRVSIAGEPVYRAVQATNSLMDVESSTVGSVQAYDTIQADYTPYTFQAGQNVLQAPYRINCPGNTTRTFTLTIPDSTQVAGIDATFSYLTTDTTSPGSGQSVFRASADVNGVNEFRNTAGLILTAVSLSPTTVQLTIQNTTGQLAWFVSSANYLNYPVGQPSIWLFGYPVTQGSQVIVTEAVEGSKGASIYQTPQSNYRQDFTSTDVYAQWLRDALQTPIPLYGNVDIVPDTNITVGDKIQLDIPIDVHGVSQASNNGVRSVECIVWGNTFTASFDSGSVEWSQQLNVRASVPPGAWELGVGVLGSSSDPSTYIY